jgi:glyoxylase-like metal-dependent hydrolase (beta-lactamase superfamily II)
MDRTPSADLPQWLAGPGRVGRTALTRFGEPARFREGLYRIGRQAYAWMVPNGAWGETNIGLIEGKGESVLIDTCWDLVCTREVLTGAAPILQRSPIEFVINTHADGDHCWGNQLFADKTRIATHACIQQMQHLSPRALTALKLAGRVLRRLPLARLDSFGHYMAEMFAPYDFRDIRITAPEEGFSHRRELTVGGTEIVLMEVGPGHTDGDAIVYVPQEGVVYAGDILFKDATPVLWAGPVSNLVKALRMLLELAPRIIVPGHGDFASRADVVSLMNYWVFIEAEIGARYARDMTPFEAARDVVCSAAFRASPFARWDSPERIVTNAYGLYREWGAKLKTLPGKLGVMDLMRQQAALAFALPAATPRIMHRPR